MIATQFKAISSIRLFKHTSSLTTVSRIKEIIVIIAKKIHTEKFRQVKRSNFFDQLNRPLGLWSRKSEIQILGGSIRAQYVANSSPPLQHFLKGAVLFAGAMTRKWAMVTRNQPWRNTARIICRCDFLF